MVKLVTLWGLRNRLNKQLQQLSKHQIHSLSNNYAELVKSLRLIPPDLVINFLKTLFQIIEYDSGYKINLKLTKKFMVDFLTVFPVAYFPDITKCHNKDILHLSKHILTKYVKMTSVPPSLTDIHSMGQLIQLFIIKYRQWELESKQTDIEALAQLFWSTSAGIYQNIASGEESLQNIKNKKEQGDTHFQNIPIDTAIQNSLQVLDNWKQEFKDGFEQLKQKAILTVKSINGNDGVKYFESLVPIFIDPSFNDSVRDLVHRAFWDALESDMDQQKYDKLINLMKELKLYLMASAPNRNDIHQEIDTVIDIKLWEQMLTHNAHNIKDITNLFDYVYDKLLKWSAHQEDANILQFKKELDEKLTTITNNNDINKIVSFFLKHSFKFLEKIIISAKQFQTTQEYQLLKNRIKELHQYNN